MSELRTTDNRFYIYLSRVLLSLDQVPTITFATKMRLSESNIWLHRADRLSYKVVLPNVTGSWKQQQLAYLWT